MPGLTGADRLRRDVAVFRRDLGEALARELQDAVDRPLRTFRDDVDEAVRRDFPARYAAVFGRTFRVNVSSTSGTAALRIKMVGTARGKAQIRDSAALNRGVLRHKTWGRLPWQTQAVRPGFWDEPGRRLAEAVRAAAQDAAAKAAAAVEASL